MTTTQKYKKLNDIEHCLLRPGMWIGATTPQAKNVWQFNPELGKYESVTLGVNEGLLKIFDEIISNSVDEHKRNGRVTEIDVTVTNDRITVRDNGGIIVEKHPEYGLWVPELIFSELKAGSNFDDSEERLVAGTNGVGSTLTNIFSQEFRVRTSDGKLNFEQKFTNNMRERTPATVIPSSDKKGYTEISFVPDLPRFSLTDLTSHVNLFRKRCTDIAAACNNLKVTFNNEVISFSSFKEYCELFVSDVLYEERKRWAIGLGVSNSGFQQISLVNAVETKEGGTHVDYVLTDVVEALKDFVKKKTKQVLKTSEIKNKLFLFVRCEVVNPAFASQTKEKLITHHKDFGTSFSPTKDFLNRIVDSEIGVQLIEWVNAKLLEEEQRAVRDANRHLSKVKVVKLVDARDRNRANCTLGLFEGDCLSSSTQVKIFRDGATTLALSDIEVGDHVITHNNTLKRVIAKSEKISKLYKVKTKYGTISASGSHRMWCYDQSLDKFDFIRIDEINLSIHKLVRNRLADIEMFLHIKSIMTQDELVLIDCGDELITSSLEHKFAVIDNLGNFKMVAAKDLQVGVHYLALSSKNNPK